MNTMMKQVFPRWIAQMLTMSIALAFLAGCASPGAMLDPAAVKQVNVGMSRAEVLRIMGEPTRTVTGPDKDRQDDYRVTFDMPHVSNRRTGDSTFTLRSLQVFYDPAGRVDFVDSYESKIPSWVALDGIPRAGIKGGVAAIPPIEADKTNLYELTEKIGEPAAVLHSLAGIKTYHWYVFEGKRQSASMDVVAELVVTLDDSRYVTDYRVFQKDK